MPDTLLTIAGYDPSSGAGITADLAVFAAHGHFGTSTITALTVQSTVGVQAVSPVAAGLLTDTLETLTADIPPRGVKIGMLASEANVLAVAAFLERLRRSAGNIPVVLDPVLSSSSGRYLLDPQAISTLRETLLPHVDWITPNVDELAALIGREALSRDEIPEAAVILRGQTELHVVVTGGHLDPPDDYLLSGETQLWVPGKLIETSATHGTGCAFSSALLCELVRESRAERAVRAAKEYVRQAMLRASPIGHGKGPMNLLWRLGG